MSKMSRACIVPARPRRHRRHHRAAHGVRRLRRLCTAASVASARLGHAARYEDARQGCRIPNSIGPPDHPRSTRDSENRVCRVRYQHMSRVADNPERGAGRLLVYVKLRLSAAEVPRCRTGRRFHFVTHARVRGDLAALFVQRKRKSDPRRSRPRLVFLQPEIGIDGCRTVVVGGAGANLFVFLLTTAALRP